MAKGQTATAMQTLEFGYKCQECGQGTVMRKVFPEYKTKLRGYPVTVQNACIGVCDRCGAEHFDPNETLRWRMELEERQSESYLQPAEIRELRKQLGLSMEHFAVLLGCTRQSLYNWERANRLAAQSRMADLFMRLIRETHRSGHVDALNFLTAEASKLGFQLSVSAKGKSVTPFVAIARKIPLSQLSDEERRPLSLAAEAKAVGEEVILVAEDDRRIARISYDYQHAALNLVFLYPVAFAEFDAEIEFSNGERIAGEHATVQNQAATLLRKTDHTEEDVVQVQFLPQQLLSTPEKK
jgi:putative zinc finger/helix-turn-helix YgiT family protein